MGCERLGGWFKDDLGVFIQFGKTEVKLGKLEMKTRKKLNT
jgi:hypothetical protein